MATVGQVLDNPVTGETLTFQATSRTTDGAALRFDVRCRAQASGPPEHVHPSSRESFQLVAGRLRLRLGGRDQILEAPATIDIPAGTPHTFWNDGPEAASIAVSYEPAGTFEHFLETLYELAADGRTNSKGVPNPFRMAVIAREHLGDITLARPPVAVQRAAFALLAPLGRLAGYGPRYSRAG